MSDPKIKYDIAAGVTGAADVERLADELAKLDTAIDPAAAARAQALATELREIGAQKAAIDRFRELKSGVAEAGEALQAAQTAAQAMGREIAAAETPTRAQAGAMQKLGDAVNAAKADLQAQTQALGAARSELQALGITTEALAAHELSLRQALAGTVAGVRELGQQQAAVARFQELGAATEKARADMVAADAAIAAFRREIVASEAPTAAEAQQLDRLAAAARQAHAAFQAQAQAHSQSGATLRALGVDTTALVAAQRQAAVSTVAHGAAAREAATGFDLIASKIDNLRNLGIAGILGSQTVQLVKQVSETADAYQNLEARVKLATGAQGDFRATFGQVYEVALRTNTSLDSTGELFSRIARAGKEIGVSQGEALRLTETINQAVQLSGSSAQASDAAVTQLIQALQSGVLRGDEFNSVMEQAPRLAQALADGLGTTTGELRKMAEAGQLSSRTVIQALQGQAAVLQSEFSQLPQTVGRALENLTTAWTRYVGEASQAHGVTKTAADLINSLAGNLDTVAAVLFGVTKAVVAYKAAGLAASFIEGGVAARTAQAAIVAKTAATVADTVAVEANTVATAGAAAGAGRFAAALSSLKLFSVVGILANFHEIGTAIGEGVAKLLGYGKALDELEIKQKADAAASRDAAAARAAHAQQLQQAADKSLGLSDVSRKLVGDFEAMTKKGEAADEAIAKLAKDLDLSSIKGIADAGAALDALGKKGLLTGQQIREAFADALKGQDLLAFETKARAAFDGSEQGARRLKAALDAIADESLHRVGTSTQEIATGFTKASTSAINDLDALAKTITGLGVKSDETGRALGKGVDKAIEAASTERAVQAVIERITELGKRGLLTGDQLADAMQKAREKVDQLKPGISSLDEALKAFGLKTREELQQTADKLKSAYEQIAQSASVSLADKAKAFIAYRDAAVAANGGVESSELKVKEEMLRLQGAAVSTGKSIGDSMTDAGAGVDYLSGRLSAAQQQMIALQREAVAQSRLWDDLAARAKAGITGDASTDERNAALTKKIGEDKARTDAINHTSIDNSTIFKIADKLKAGTLTLADAAAVRAVNEAAQANFDLMQHYSTSYSFEGQQGALREYNTGRFALEKIQELERQAAAAKAGGSINGAPVGTPAAGAPASTSHTVTIKLPNGTAGTVNTASAADASSLAALMRQLGQDARSAGATV